MIVHPIKLGKKKIHQGEIRFWESIKLWRKKEVYQVRKGILIKMREKWYIKRHKRHEIPWKIIQVEREEQKKWRFIIRRNSIKLRKIRKEKARYISLKEKSVQSSQETWKCLRKDKRTSNRNANSSNKDDTLSNWNK